MARNSQRVSLPRTGSVARGGRSAAYTGATSIPRGRLTQESQRPYPDPPPSWQGPVTEWVVWDYFTRVKHFKPGKDFYYQAALPALGVFRSKGFTRVDFLVPVAPRGPASAPGRYRAVVIDPITPFTHRNVSLDRLKRVVLGNAGYLLIWVDGARLETGPRDVLEKALKGIDVSLRARGH